MQSKASTAHILWGTFSLLMHSLILWQKTMQPFTPPWFPIPVQDIFYIQQLMDQSHQPLLSHKKEQILKHFRAQSVERLFSQKRSKSQHPILSVSPSDKPEFKNQLIHLIEQETNCFDDLQVAHLLVNALKADPFYKTEVVAVLYNSLLDSPTKHFHYLLDSLHFLSISLSLKLDNCRYRSYLTKILELILATYSDGTKGCLTKVLNFLESNFMEHVDETNLKRNTLLCLHHLFEQQEVRRRFLESPQCISECLSDPELRELAIQLICELTQEEDFPDEVFERVVQFKTGSFSLVTKRNILWGLSNLARPTLDTPVFEQLMDETLATKDPCLVREMSYVLLKARRQHDGFIELVRRHPELNRQAVINVTALLN